MAHKGQPAAPQASTALIVPAHRPAAVNEFSAILDEYP